MNLDELIVSLTLDPSGFTKGASDTDAAVQALKKNAISAAEAAHAAAQESAKAAQAAAKATEEYAKAGGTAAEASAKKQMDAARAVAATAALTAAQTKKTAQDAAGVLAKSVNDQIASEKKIRDERDKTSKQETKNHKEAAEQINSLKNQVLGLFAAYETGKGLLSFVNSTNAAEQAAGRLAARVGISTEELSAQENAAQLLGAKLGDVAQSYEAIAQKKADFLIRGNLVNSEINLIAAGVQGIQSVDFGGDAKTVHETLLHNVHEISEKRGGQFAQDYGQKAGLSQGEIDNAIGNTDAKRAQALVQGRANALNDRDVAGAGARNQAAAELEQTAQRLGQTLLTEATPAITEFENALTGLFQDMQAWEKENPDWSKPIGDFAKYIGSPEFKSDVKEFESDVKEVATDVNAVAQAMGGWTRVAEILIGLKIVSWISSLLIPLGRLAGMLTKVSTAGTNAGKSLNILQDSTQQLNKGTLTGAVQMAMLAPAVKNHFEEQENLTVDDIASGKGVPDEGYSKNKILDEAKKRFGSDVDGFEQWKSALEAKTQEQGGKNLFGNTGIDYSAKGFSAIFGPGGLFGRKLTDKEQEEKSQQLDNILSKLPKQPSSDTSNSNISLPLPSMSLQSGSSRGERNNNPLNLEFAGQQGATSDGRFARFATMEEGIAAATKQLFRYGDRGVNTISGIISKWAPAGENNTAAYIASVSKETGIDANAPINIHDPAIASAIVRAMAKVEIGKNLDPAQISSGVSLASKGAGGGGSSGLGAMVGAATQPGAAVQVGQNTSTDNSRSIQSETHIGQVNINTSTADPAGHAAEFTKNIQQYDYASDFNTSVI